MGIVQIRRYGFGLEIASDVSKRKAKCVACNNVIPKQTRRIVMRSPQVRLQKVVKGVPYVFRPKLFFHEMCYLAPLGGRSCRDCGCGLPDYCSETLCMPCLLSDRYRHCMSCQETVRTGDTKVIGGWIACQRCSGPYKAELEYQQRYDEIMSDLVLKDKFI